MPDIEPYLTQLGDYCKATYGLPAYRRHREDTRQDWKLRWTNKKRIQTIQILFLHFVPAFIHVKNILILEKCQKQVDRLRNTFIHGIGGQGVHGCQSFDS